MQPLSRKKNTPTHTAKGHSGYDTSEEEAGREVVYLPTVSICPAFCLHPKVMNTNMTDTRQVYYAIYPAREGPGTVTSTEATGFLVAEKKRLGVQGLRMLRHYLVLMMVAQKATVLPAFQGYMQFP